MARIELEMSLFPGQLRYFGKMVVHLLPKMDYDPAQYPAYSDSVEDIFRTIHVPKNTHAKLILSKLNDRSLSLLMQLLLEVR